MALALPRLLRRWERFVVVGGGGGGGGDGGGGTAASCGGRIMVHVPYLRNLRELAHLHVVLVGAVLARLVVPRELAAAVTFPLDIDKLDPSAGRRSSCSSGSARRRAGGKRSTSSGCRCGVVRAPQVWRGQAASERGGAGTWTPKRAKSQESRP